MTQNRFYSSTTKAMSLTADPGPTGTTLTVDDSTKVASLDGQWPYTLAINWGQSDQELVNVTARPTGTTLTVQRGQDGTAGVSHPIGATVTHDVSARDFNEAGAHIGSLAGVHGVTGSVVGTSDSQTLTNKTLTSPTINTPTLTATTVNGALTVNGNISVSGTSTGIVYSATVSGSVDASGFLTVTHSAGFTPSGGFFVNTSPASSFAAMWGMDSITSTSVRIRFENASAGGALASGTSVTGRMYLFK